MAEGFPPPFSTGLGTGYGGVLKCCQLIQQHQLAAEGKVFGDNSAAEFQILPRKRVAPHINSISTPKERDTCLVI